MVFVKVRETYDLHTTKNKMTVIGIHTPKSDIIKKNYPGLLMQCKAYRPVSADVKIACASVLPLDPKGVGLSENDVAPEDVFNPILYKAMSNKGMSQLEARINQFLDPLFGVDVDGPSASVDVDSVTSKADEFGLYYGLLSQTHDWKHANPQSGLEMTGLKPLVYEMLYNVGDMPGAITESVVGGFAGPKADGLVQSVPYKRILGGAKPMPFLPCTSYSLVESKESEKGVIGYDAPGFGDAPNNCSVNVPEMNVFCGCIIVPPSRLHELFYRMVVEWTIEFSKIRPIGEITNWDGLEYVGNNTHFQNYSYEETKKAILGDTESVLKGDACMVASNVDVKKVM